MPSRPGDTGWGERASREQKGKRNFLPRLSLSPPPRRPGGPGARSPVALGFGHPRTPALIPGALRFPYGRRPLAEGRWEGLRQQATHGGGRGSPAPPRMAGGADRERALCGAALGGQRQDSLPHPLEARSQAGLPGAAGRCALQVSRACAPGKEEGILQSQQKPPGGVTEPACRTDEQDVSGLVTEDKDKEQPSRLAQQDFLLPSPLADHSYQAQNPAHPWNLLPSEDFSNPDGWLHVRLFYRAELVREATALAAEGCSLSPRAAATAAERLLGPPPRVAQVRFPEPPAGAHVLRRLLPHLERGVLLWVAPEGVFAKRLCQGRVYWRGPLAPHRARPNKLERERTCQLLDTRRFLAELRAHLQDGRPEPEYQIRLCFGEEYPGPPDQPEERLIMAHAGRLGQWAF
ncbi:dual specificity protein phosphatase 15 isoform X5 [Moschus berezovskii]|uniref:dual specificity protein phosphatase 15 isoform X5 n=1 Tax=Moschus berezovskii TaxID=68408 RepID=UPI00244482A6|nr:dual specificity protein phosphatase 15 isoform X5 [Moschus berezovskii]